jgi:hypothetical protein
MDLYGGQPPSIVPDSQIMPGGRAISKNLRGAIMQPVFLVASLHFEGSWMVV